MTQQSAVFLAHYGVAGMKWGKTKGSSDSGGGSKTPKPSTAQIKEARYKQQVVGRKMQEAQGDFMVARGKKDIQRTEKIVRKLEKEVFDSDNARMAAKATKGEKAAATAIYGAAGLMLIGVLVNR